ncbi:hypothetical protein BGZ73_003708 [Actinomortierella ambigua]|nr:hypothetical protein BGZ73_003708 [Actinomortierella ambigua]
MRQTRLSLVAFALALSTLVSSQSPSSPRPVFAPASVFIENKSLWVHGGSDASNNYRQFFTLDLGSSWSTANPKVTMLPPTANANSHHTAALTKERDNMIVFSRSSAITRCQLQTATWSTDMATSQFNDRYQLDAVTDPNTGNIYVPGGYGTSQSMMIYSPETKVATQDSINYLLQYIGYAAMWNTQRKSVMTFGGNILNTSTAIHEYVPGVGWDVVSFQGDAPPSRSNGCLVPAYNGTKAVLFGGFNNSTYYSDIYILDQGTMTWTKGPVGSFGGRAMSACAVTGDQFVSWGGYDGTDAISKDITVVFNLKTMQWQTNFVANTEISGGSKKAAIIGGVVGGIAVVALAAIGFIVYRRKKAQRVAEPATAADAVDATGGAGGVGNGVKMYDYNQLNLQQPQHISYYDPSHTHPGLDVPYVPLTMYESSVSPDIYHQQQHQQHPPHIFQPPTPGTDLSYIPPQPTPPQQQQYPGHPSQDFSYDASHAYVPQMSMSGHYSPPASAVDSVYNVPTEVGQTPSSQSPLQQQQHNPQALVDTPGVSQPQDPQFVPPPGSTTL